MSMYQWTFLVESVHQEWICFVGRQYIRSWLCLLATPLSYPFDKSLLLIPTKVSIEEKESIDTEFWRDVDYAYMRQRGSKAIGILFRRVFLCHPGDADHTGMSEDAKREAYFYILDMLTSSSSVNKTIACLILAEASHYSSPLKFQLSEVLNCYYDMPGPLI